MTRDEARRIEDASQESRVAEIERARAEKRLARQIAQNELMRDGQQAWHIVTLVMAWASTDDDRFGWLLGVVVTAEVVAYSYLFRKPVTR
jgi:hypothetical protein